MYYFEGSVHVEKEDQCMTCKNFAEGVACPLLQALAMGLVSLDGTLYVRNCGFYEEFVRRLKLVAPVSKKAQSSKSTKKPKK